MARKRKKPNDHKIIEAIQNCISEQQKTREAARRNFLFSVLTTLIVNYNKLQELFSQLPY